MAPMDYATNSHSVVFTREDTKAREGDSIMKANTATIRSFSRPEATVAAATGSTQRALSAWRASRRRRFAHGTADAIADAAFATGGLMVANAILRLDVGVPGGRIGVMLGIVLIGLGAAIAKAANRKNTLRPDPAATARPVVIRLDEPAPKVIYLDSPADLEVRRAA